MPLVRIDVQEDRDGVAVVQVSQQDQSAEQKQAAYAGLAPALEGCGVRPTTSSTRSWPTSGPTGGPVPVAPSS